jgi:hypothetical protein
MMELQATVMTLRQSANGWKRLMQTAPAIPSYALSNDARRIDGGYETDIHK